MRRTRFWKVRPMGALLVMLSLTIVCIGTGCDGSGYRRSIPAKAFPSGTVLEIQTGARLNPGTYAAYGAHQFSSELSLFSLTQTISCENGTFQNVADSEQDPAGVLIWVPRDDGTKDVYYLEKQGVDGDTAWYVFSGLCYRIRRDQMEQDEEERMDQALFPGFCLKDPPEEFLELSYGVPYLCDSIIVGDRAWEDLPQELAAFYEATGVYDAELEDSTLFVSPRDAAPERPALELRFERVGEEMYLTILPPQTAEIL